MFGTKTLTIDTGRSSILLRDLMIELSDKILRHDEIPDWYNNDGGFGVLEWIVAHTDKAGTPHTDRISVTVNEAVINTSNFEYDGYGNRAGAV